jgi:hypothetical protein
MMAAAPDWTVRDIVNDEGSITDVSVEKKIFLELVGIED